MADDQGQKQVEEQAQHSAVPTEEQKGQDENSSQVEVPTGSEESFEAPAGESEDELPSRGVSERTREQFEKLRSQLREARRRIFEMTGSRESAGEIKPLYDKSTGLIDVDALQDLQKRAYEAERKATLLEQKISQQTQDSQVRELYSVYPELKNPKTREAKELFDESERIWMHSQAYPEKYGGYPLTQKQAADLAKKRMDSTTKAKEAQAIEAKEQASFGATGRPTQGVQTKVTSEEELERLRYGTRVGDKDSMVARMRAIREASEPK